jgi:stage II sporulation protein M
MKSEKHSGFFGGLYRRNENFLLLSAGIFLGSIIIGYLFSGILEPLLSTVLEQFKRNISEGQIQLTTLSIFANNFKITFSIYASGLSLGIFSVIILITNGIFIGFVASQYPLGSFLIFTLPHGVIEMLGIIISGAAGFRLASYIFNILKGATKINTDISIKNQLSYLFELNMDEFKESLTLFIIAVILILIAAFIEATFTIPWGSYVSSL